MENARDRLTSRHWMSISAIAIAALAVFADAATWVELDVAAIYGLPLLIAALARSRGLLWLLLALLTTATFMVYAAQIPPGAFALHEPLFVNRVLDAVALALTCGLLHVWLSSVEVREAQAALLEDQNDKLAAANAELLLREQQIASQNTELERRREEAEEASGRKTQLLASASHDIRTPVNAINLMAQLIARTAEDPTLAARIPHLAQRLQVNAASLVDLVSSLLDIAHFDSGRVAVDENVFALNELIASKCRDLLPLLQTKPVRLDTDIPAGTIWLRTDRIKLGRVFSNLLSNAIKFTERGTVTVSVGMLPDRAVVISVRDTGPGIPADQLHLVFREFARVETPNAESRNGWGLGLAICQRLTKLLGGTITVTSTVDQGSTFTVRLPAHCVLENETADEPPARVMTVELCPSGAAASSVAR